MSHVMHYIPRE